MEKNPYLGPQLNAGSEVVFLPNATKNDAMRYVKSWRLSVEGEGVLLGNCLPDVVAEYIEYWPLHEENEPRLIHRKDSRLIRRYVKKFPLSKETQILFAEQGNKEDLDFFLKESPYPLFGDTIIALNNRGYALKQYNY